MNAIKPRSPLQEAYRQLFELARQATPEQRERGRVAAQVERLRWEMADREGKTE